MPNEPDRETGGKAPDGPMIPVPPPEDGNSRPEPVAGWIKGTEPDRSLPPPEEEGGGDDAPEEGMTVELEAWKGEGVAEPVQAYDDEDDEVAVPLEVDAEPVPEDRTGRGKRTPLRKKTAELRNKKTVPGQGSFSNGNGLTNGRRSGRVNGLTNGRGLSNGNVNGLRNRRGMSNGNGLTNGKGVTNGIVNGLRNRKGISNGNGFVNGRRGTVNGLTNGRRKGRVNGNGLINGNGYVNGRSKGVVNGLVNGRGIVNGQGLTNGQRMEVDERPPPRKSSRKAMAVALVSIFIVAVLLGVYLQLGAEKGIRVDGLFSDWSGAKKFQDDIGDCTNPEINIARYAFDLDGTQASFYLKVEGKAMDGRNGGVDSWFIFIDTDQNTATGYYIDTVGAEYVIAIDGYDGHVSASGLYRFSRDTGRPTNDWNSRQAVGACRAAVAGNELEAQAALTDLGAGAKPAMNVLFYTRDGSGCSDFATVVGTEPVNLRMLWSRVGPDTVAPGAANVPMMRVEMSSAGGNSTLTALRTRVNDAIADGDITRVGASSTAGFDLPGTMSQFIGGVATINFEPALQVPSGGSLTIVICISMAGNAATGKAIGLSILSPADVTASTRTITIERGGQQYSYIGQSTAQIRIDGAFDDWGGYQTRTDALGDCANPDIDVTDFRLTNDTGSLYFYVQVDGAVMGGTGIPETKLRPQTGPGGGPGGPPVQLPVIVGEDALFLFVDTDNNTATGYNGGGLPIGADCLVNITGQYGKISYRKFHDFTGGASRGTWSWSNGIDIAAANDIERLEIGVPMSSLHNPTGNLSVYYYTTDWKARKDTGGRESLQLQIPGGRYYQERVQASFTDTTGNVLYMNDAYFGIITNADFNNDGLKDIVYSTTFNNSKLSSDLVVLKNDGTPFAGDWPATTVGTSTDDFWAVEAADFDNDGDMDLVTGGAKASSELMLWQNDGTPFDGAWSTNKTVSVGYAIYDVCIADFNNDGWMDVGTGQVSGDNYEVSVWKNDKSPFTGTWSQTDVAAPDCYIYEIVSADLDNDGDMDLAVETHLNTSSGAELQVYQNDGTPFDGLWSWLGAGDTGGYYSLDVGDVNRDGYPDLLTADENGAIILWQNDKTPFSGTWTGTTVEDLTERIFDAVFIDLDNDGQRDIVGMIYGSDDYPEIAYWTNKGNPFGGSSSWSRTGLYESPGTGWDPSGYSVTVSDFDNDGDIDIAGMIQNFEAGDGPNQIHLFENKLIHRNATFGDGAFKVDGTARSFVKSLTGGDYDNDGDYDLIIGELFSSYDIIAYINDGTPFSGSWSTSAIDTSSTVYIENACSADIDNDGDMDVIVLYETTGSTNIKIYQNDGTPFDGAWTSYNVGTAGSSPYSVASADVDNDGDLDIITGDYGYKIYIWKNDGTAWDGTWAGTQIGSMSNLIYDMRVADFDNDGWTDIVTVDGTYRIYCWENNGTPYNDNWSKCDLDSNNSMSIYNVEVADFDLDGWTDIFISGRNDTGETAVYKNDGTPFSGSWVKNRVGAMTHYSAYYLLDVADFNNDGKLDVVSKKASNNCTVWLNDWTPFSGNWASLNLSTLNEELFVIQSADLDNDGDVDIYGMSGQQNSPFTGYLYLWQNTGGQVNETATGTAPANLLGGASDDVFKVVVTHNGMSGDNDIELAKWRLKFYKSDGTTSLTNSELTGTISNYAVFVDGNANGVYDSGTDTAYVALTCTTSVNEAILTFTDGNTNAAVSATSSKTYFIVITLANSPPVNDIKITFDPDGYGTGDYNEIEDASTDRIVVVQVNSSIQTGPIHAPEFSDVLLPLAGMMVVVFLVRRKAGQKKKK